MKMIEMVGSRFGRLVVIEKAPGPVSGDTRWLCRCDCGATKAVRGHKMRSGRTTSCGCFFRDQLAKRKTTHGATRHGRITKEYNSWCDMLKRCTNPSCISYPRYGGRGISICERWAGSFENFLADMGPRPEGTTLDRKDNDGNYEPGNCRWATKLQQARNTRTNRFITWGGVSRTIAEWAELLPVSAATLGQRINKLGWPIDRAMTAPVRRRA